MKDNPKSLSVIMTLFDDEATRADYEHDEKLAVMIHDDRNPVDEFMDRLESEFLQWGASYRITVSEDREYGQSTSTVETLFDDASTRKKFTVMLKLEVMCDDERNGDMDFWIGLDSFIEWGKTYRLTFEEVE